MRKPDYRNPARRRELEALLAHATPHQRRCIEAVLEHGTVRAAAKAIGGVDTGGNVSRAIKAAKRVAALYEDTPRGPQGERHNNPSVSLAFGQELKRQTIHLAPDGALLDRYDLTQAERNPPQFEPVPPGHLVTKTTTRIDADGRVGMQYVTAKAEAVARWEATKTAITEFVAEHVRPVDPVPAPTVTDADQISVYNLGDPHVGMLAWAPEVGESFDLKIAERELCQCFEMLVDRAPATERAIVTNLGDFWHAQGADQLTPRGKNKLDVDGRKGKVGNVGLAILHTLIDSALRKHERVDFRSLPGNHDPDDAFWIAAEVRAWYRHEPRVTVHDAFNPYQFEQFGNCLFGWCHGDGAKLEALGEIMSVDARAEWGVTDHHYWHVGHVHHNQVKELRGCTVETHNTLAGRDAWHHHSGYRSKRMLRVHVYHREWGLDSVGVVGVERVRAALLKKAA
jgi:hypothetical protein